MFEGESRSLDVAAGQYGVIARAQARALGMSARQIEHRIREGRWVVVHPGVYRIAGAAMSPRQRAMAACLWLGDDAVVSHTTAARMFHLEGVPKRTPLHVTVPPGVRHSSRGPRPFVLHRVTGLHCQDRVLIDGVPSTSPLRTIVDLAALVDEEDLELAFESARRSGLVSLDSLASTASDLVGRGRKGSAEVRRLLQHQSLDLRPLESALEVKAWRLIRTSGLPLPERQVPLRAWSDERYRVDYLWRAQRVIGECDGFEAHAGRLRWKRDRKRLADLELLGFRIIHITSDDVTRRPRDTLRRLGLALVANLVT